MVCISNYDLFTCKEEAQVTIRLWFESVDVVTLIPEFGLIKYFTKISNLFYKDKEFSLLNCGFFLEVSNA